MFDLPPFLSLLPYLIPILALAGAWGGAGHAMKSTATRVDKVETDVEALKAAAARASIDVTTRLVRVETKLDILLGSKQ